MIVISCCFVFFFFFNDTATTEIYTLSLHDALPISRRPTIDRPELAELDEAVAGRGAVEHLGPLGAEGVAVLLSRHTGRPSAPAVVAAVLDASSGLAVVAAALAAAAGSAVPGSAGTRPPGAPVPRPARVRPARRARVRPARPARRAHVRPARSARVREARPARPARPARVQPGSARGAGGVPAGRRAPATRAGRSEEHTSELQSRRDIVCRLLLDK